jgi:hypothetical protein
MKTPVAPQGASTAFAHTIEGTWYVKTREGVLSLTLDELDEAFQRGELDAQSLVFTSGMDAWDTLGNVANLDSAAAANDVATPPEASGDDGADSTREALDVGTFPPTTTGVFGNRGLPWANIAPPDSDAHTVVRRSTGVVPYPIRSLAGKVADLAARVRLLHPRLSVFGPWMFGAALSGILVFALYEFGASATRPGPHTKSTSTLARSSAHDARPVTATAATLLAPPSAAAPASGSAALRVERASPMVAQAAGASKDSDASEDSDPGEGSAVTTVRPVDLQLAKPSRAEASLARSARAKAKASKASSGRKARAHGHRKLAKRSTKRGSTALD